MIRMSGDKSTEKRSEERASSTGAMQSPGHRNRAGVRIAVSANGQQSKQIQVAQDHFRSVVKSELNTLLQTGVRREIAVQQLLSRIVERSVEPKTEEVQGVMRTFGLNQEDATRALIVKQELGRLKRRGLNPLAAIEELTRKMQGTTVHSPRSSEVGECNPSSSKESTDVLCKSDFRETDNEVANDNDPREPENQRSDAGKDEKSQVKENAQSGAVSPVVVAEESQEVIATNDQCGRDSTPTKVCSSLLTANDDLRKEKARKELSAGKMRRRSPSHSGRLDSVDVKDRLFRSRKAGLKRKQSVGCRVGSSEEDTEPACDQDCQQVTGDKVIVSGNGIIRKRSLASACVPDDEEATSPKGGSTKTKRQKCRHGKTNRSEGYSSQSCAKRSRTDAEVDTITDGMHQFSVRKKRKT